MKNRTIQSNKIETKFPGDQAGPDKHQQDKTIILSPFGPGTPPNYKWDDSNLPIRGIAKRDWFDADRKTKNLAHFCLPLMMANGAGYYLTSPVHFKSTWDGDRASNAKIEILNRLPHGVVDDHSTCGGFTIQSGLNFRTENQGDFIWVKQIPNLYRPWFYPMEALLEGWWMNGGATAGLVCLHHRAGTFEMKIGDPIAQIVVISKNDLEANLIFEDEIRKEGTEWQKRRQRPEYGKNESTRKPGGSNPDLDYLYGRWPDGNKTPVHLTNWNSNKVLRNGEENKKSTNRKSL